MTTFTTAYGPKLKSPITFNGTGRTKQSFKDECDINTIMKRFQVTGLIDFVNDHEPQYGDTSGINFHDSMNQVAVATSMFEDLPASTRKHFDNDPSKFIELVNDPDRIGEARELGLMGPERTPAAQAKQDAADAAAAATAASQAAPAAPIPAQPVNAPTP